MRISTILIFTSLLLTTVKAGVFTTSPFSKTIWTAGATETITWKDDGKNPSITTLKKLQIDLFNGNDTSIQTFVRNVANDVDGNTKKFTYAVPSDVGPEGQYFLKYTEGSYVETSGVFQIINSANISIPAAVPVTTSASAGIYPPATTGTGTGTGTSTTGANANTASASNPTLTPTPLSGDGNISHINNLTLGSLMILSSLLLKYL